ncbi:hypothetical protein ACTWQI_18990 [Streptomyces sp. KR80]
MSRAARAACCALTALVTAVLVGCDTSQPTGRSASPLPKPPAFSGRLSTSAVDLATHSGTWPATQRTLQSALDELVRACLKKKGFGFPADDVEALTPPEDEAAAIDLAGRRKTGYGISVNSTESTENSAELPPVDRYYATLSKPEQRRFDEALAGPPDRRRKVSGTGWGDVLVPEEGCEAEGRRQLAGDGVLWARITYVPEKFGNQLADRVAKEPEYTRVVTTWRSCMKARGHPYEDPDGIRPRLEKEFRTTGPTEAFRKREIAVAVADGECALRAHIPSVSLEVQRGLVTTLTHREQRTLAELAAYRDAAVERARKITATAQSRDRAGSARSP